MTPLTKLISECGLLMPYLAKRLGVSIHTLYAWAYGKRTTPQHVLDKLEHIKKAQDEILGKDE